MRKRIRFYIFIFICLAQLLFLTYSLFRGLNKGEIVRLKCELYDPYDPIKGRYLSLSFDIERQQIGNFPSFENEISDIENEEIKNKRIYCSLSPSNNEILNISFKKPKEGLFLKAKIRSKYRDQIIIDFPFNNYFIQENFAKIAENIIRQSEDKIIIVLSINPSGNARIKALEINNIPIEEIILERTNENKLRNVL